MLAALFYYSVPAFATLTGAGTAADPYLIGSAADLNEFATGVNDGSITNHNVELTADISYSGAMIGTSTNKYHGVFDGKKHTITIALTATNNYSALFCYINGATVKNMHITGTLNAGNYKFCAALIGQTSGTVLVSCITSDVAITCNQSSDGCASGLVSQANGGTLNMENCGFYGSFAGSGTRFAGLFADRTNNATINLTNCYGAAVNGSVTNFGDIGASSYGDCTNCYYPANSSASIKKGTARPVSDFQDGTVAYLLNRGINNGVWKQETGKYPVLIGGEPITKGLEQDSEGYLLINNEADWNKFVLNVDNFNDAAKGKITNNLTFTSGTSSVLGKNKTFKGILDGQKHTITLNIEASEDYSAPIRNANGATVKNMHITGTLNAGSKQFCAALIGQTSGTVLVSCITSDVAITCNKSDGCASGLVSQANGGTLNMENCGFYGSFAGSGTRFAGLFADKISSATINLTNCYGAAVNGSVTNFGDISASNAGTYTNCYYPENSSASYKKGTERSVSDFQDGTVAILLNRGGDNPWYQSGNVRPVLFSGTPVGLPKDKDGNFLISNERDWNVFATVYNMGLMATANMKLTADLDFSKAETKEYLTLIGTASKNYTGTFDGGYHTIKIDAVANAYYWGLFSYTGAATLKNVHITGNLDTNTQRYCGSFVGLHNSNGKLLTINSVTSNVTINTASSSANNYIGGIIGELVNGSLEMRNIGYFGIYTGDGTYCDGIIGYHDTDISKSNARIYDSYVAALSKITGSNKTTRIYGDIPCTNCYYRAGSNFTQFDAENFQTAPKKATKSAFENDSVCNAMNGNTLKDGPWYQCTGYDSVPRILSTCAAPEAPVITAASLTKDQEFLSLSWTQVTKLVNGYIAPDVITYKYDVSKDSIFTPDSLLKNDVEISGSLEGGIYSVTISEKFPSCFIRIRAIHRETSSANSNIASVKSLPKSVSDGTGMSLDSAKTQVNDKLKEWKSACSGSNEINLTIVRTIYKDGYYNTLCLPFDLSHDQITSTFGAYKDLKEFESATVEGPDDNRTIVITLNTVEEITAGKAYLISFENGTDMDHIDFQGVIVTDTIATTADTLGNMAYQGTFAPKQLPSDKNYLFLGTQDKLYWPNADGTFMKGFRAFFTVSTAKPGSPYKRGMKAVFGDKKTPTSVHDAQCTMHEIQKLVEQGRVVIITNGKKYDLQGNILE